MPRNSVSVVLPVVIDLSAGVVEVYGDNITNTNPYSINALGDNLLASDLSGFFWYIQDASGANPDLLSCWTVSKPPPTDLNGNPITVPNDLITLLVPFINNTNAVLNDYVRCSGQGFQDDYVNLPSSAYSDNNPMYKFASLYNALLGRIAFDIFGHPLAQAGIDNDTELLQAMRQNDAGTRLCNALMNLTEAQVRLIYEQMLYQDSERFKNIADVPLDVSGVVLTNSPESLQFLSGDSITFEITFKSSAVGRAFNTAKSNSQLPFTGSTNNTGPSANVHETQPLVTSLTDTAEKTYSVHVVLA